MIPTYGIILVGCNESLVSFGIFERGSQNNELISYTIVLLGNKVRRETSKESKNGE